MNKGIDIRILNTFNPAFPGTLITARKVVSDRTVKGIASHRQRMPDQRQGDRHDPRDGHRRTDFQRAGAHGDRRHPDHAIVLRAQRMLRRPPGTETRRAGGHRARVPAGAACRGDLRRSPWKTTSRSSRWSERRRVTSRGSRAKCSRPSERTASTSVRSRRGHRSSTSRSPSTRSSEAKALNALHDNLFLSQFKTVHLFVIGTGLVGSALLDLVREQARLRPGHLHINIKDRRGDQPQADAR